jgi:hypothetical protein
MEGPELARLTSPAIVFIDILCPQWMAMSSSARRAYQGNQLSPWSFGFLPT